MGKQIHLTKVLRLFEKSPVVDFKSILRIVGKRSYAKLLVSTLLKKNVLKKIGKGVYTIHEESSLSVFAYTPAYLGLQSALSYHKLWEQETIPIVITTRKVRRGVRVVLGSNILVRNIDTKYFFGFEYVLDGKFYVPYSDIEKTAIDACPAGEVERSGCRRSLSVQLFFTQRNRTLFAKRGGADSS